MESNHRLEEFPDPFEGTYELDDQTYYEKHLRPMSSQSSVWRFSPELGYNPLPADQDKAFEETLSREQLMIDEIKELTGGSSNG